MSSAAPHFNAKVFITSAYPDPEPISSFKKAITLAAIKRHTLVENPEEADIILFVENSRYHLDYSFKKLRQNEIVKKYRDITFMYNPHDKPWFIFPGLYTSMPRRLFDNNHMAACPFLEIINPFIRCDFSVSPKYLFSFLGTLNSPARRKILQLNHSRGYLKAAHRGVFGDLDDNVKMQYADLLTDSKFVLAPRGAGTSSYRLFETMQAGRVPVIISDEWVPPKGPQWTEFALFVEEKQIKWLPDILEQEEGNWEGMARCARNVWLQYFAPDVIFNYFIGRIVELQQSKSGAKAPAIVPHYFAFLKFAFRRLVIQNIREFTQSSDGRK